MTIQEIRKIAHQYCSTKQYRATLNDPSFMSMCVVLYGLLNATSDIRKIAHGTRYSTVDVTPIIENIRKYKRINEEGKWVLEDDNETLWVDICLLSLLGEGQIICYQEEGKVCQQCKRDKPISSFGVTRNHERGSERVSSYCLDCNRARVSDWGKNNRKKINERNSEGRKNLDEWYVRKLLKKQHGKKYVEENPQAVEQYREYLKTKRQYFNQF